MLVSEEAIDLWAPDAGHIAQSQAIVVTNELGWNA